MSSSKGPLSDNASAAKAKTDLGCKDTDGGSRLTQKVTSTYFILFLFFWRTMSKYREM